MARIHRKVVQKKGLNDSNNHPDNDNVVTHLEPDSLKHEVRWALGSITTNKASGSDRILAKLIKILKDNTVKVLPSNLENSAEATGLEKVSF